MEEIQKLYNRFRKQNSKFDLKNSKQHKNKKAKIIKDKKKKGVGDVSNTEKLCDILMRY